MQSEPFQPITTPRGSDLIVQEIWDLIKQGKLLPGDKLPAERELMQRFGVSKAVLREALNTLEAYGHITKKRGAQGGSIILDLNPDKGVDLILDYLKAKKVSREDTGRMMDLLLAQIVPQVIENLDSRGKKRIEDLIEQHKRDFETHGGSPCGWRFPILLGELTGNPFFHIFMQVVVRSFISLELSAGIGDLNSTDLETKYNTIAYELTIGAAQALLDGNVEKTLQIITKKGDELEALL